MSRHSDPSKYSPTSVYLLIKLICFDHRIHDFHVRLFCSNSPLFSPFLLLHFSQSSLIITFMRSLFSWCRDICLLYKWASEVDKHHSIFGCILSQAYFHLLWIHPTSENIYYACKFNKRKWLDWFGDKMKFVTTRGIWHIWNVSKTDPLNIHCIFVRFILWRKIIVDLSPY